jgi:hypothetical protein
VLFVPKDLANVDAEVARLRSALNVRISMAQPHLAAAR